MNGKVLAGLMVLAAGGVTLGLLGGDKGGDTGPTDPVAIVEELRVELRTAMLTAACTPEPVPPPALVDCWGWECRDLEHGDPVCTWRLGFVPPGCADPERMVSVPVQQHDKEGKEIGKPEEVNLPTCLPLDQDGVCETVDRTWVGARDAYRSAVAAREDERAKCPGGVQVAPVGHGCLCMAAAVAARVEGEAQVASDLAPADRINLVVCCDRGQARVLRLPAGDLLKPGCRSVGQPVSDFSMGGYETDFSRLMVAACSPCPGPGGAHCPACLCAPGGCAETCR
jgi:hypothetical protein